MLGQLLRLELSLLRRRLWPPTPGRLAAPIAIGMVAAAAVWVEYVFFHRVFSYLLAIPALPRPLLLGLLERFLDMVFLASFSGLIVSNAVVMLSLGLAAADLEFLFSTPAPARPLLAVRFAKVAAHSSYAAVFFMLPMLAAVAAVLERGLVFWLYTTILLAAFLVPPAVLGAGAVILLARFFPAARIHQWVTSLGVLCIAAIVIALRLVQPELLFNPTSATDFVEHLSRVALPPLRWYPSSWLAHATLHGAGWPSVALMGLAAVALGLFLGLAPETWRRAWQRRRESGRIGIFDSRRLDRIVENSAKLLPASARPLFEKDVKIFWRDTSQWTQLILIGALVFLYLYNIRSLSAPDLLSRHLVAFLNLGMTGFFLAAFALRFAYPAVSVEGRSFWMLAAAPLNFRRLLAVKALVYALPLAFLGEILTLGADWLLGTQPEVTIITTTTVPLIAITLVCLGVGMGALAPRFHAESPVQVGMSPGGITYMLVALLYVGAMTAVAAQPFHRFFARLLGMPGFADPGEIEAMSWRASALPYAAAIAGSLALGVAALELGARRLRRLEISPS